MGSKGPTHSWDIVIIIIITLIICNRRRMRVRSRSDQILITQLDFVMARQITVVFCLIREGSYVKQLVLVGLLQSILWIILSDCQHHLEDICTISKRKKYTLWLTENKVVIKVKNIRCWATATAAIRQGGPWEPESEVTLAPASLSLSEAIANGSASKFALISSARSTHRSAAFLCAWPSAYAKGRLPKLARIFAFYKIN